MGHVLESDPHESEAILKVALQDWIEVWVLLRHFVHPIRDFGSEVLFVRAILQGRRAGTVRPVLAEVCRGRCQGVRRCFTLAPYSR